MDELSSDEGDQRAKYDPDVGHISCEFMGSSGYRLVSTDIIVGRGTGCFLSVPSVCLFRVSCTVE